MKKEQLQATKLWKRTDLIKCPNCSEMVDIRPELKAAREEVINEIPEGFMTHTDLVALKQQLKANTKCGF